LSFSFSSCAHVPLHSRIAALFIVAAGSSQTLHSTFISLLGLSICPFLQSTACLFRPFLGFCRRGLSDAMTISNQNTFGVYAINGQWSVFFFLRFCACALCSPLFFDLPFLCVRTFFPLYSGDLLGSKYAPGFFAPVIYGLQTSSPASPPFFQGFDTS